MAYINKKLKQLIVHMDETFSIDKGVNKFVRNNIYPQHNLIIKLKDNTYHCTNCQKEWYSHAKVDSLLECPRCKQRLTVKTSRLHYYPFWDDFRIIEYIDEHFVLRAFEVKSIYTHNRISHSITEYQRLVISKDKEYLLYSNAFKMYLSTRTVDHSVIPTTWRLYESYYAKWYHSNEIIYWGHLENSLKGFKYQYCPIEKVLSNNTDRINELLRMVLNYPISFELLSKMGLTNLALESNKFTIKGSFKNRFLGLSKDYLPFMIKYNITYEQLKILSIIKRKNITIIRKLDKLSRFDALAEYYDMVKLLDYGLNKDNEIMYSDYISMAERLGLNIHNKKVLYIPADEINKEHDKLLKQINDIENKEIQDKIIKRYEELKDNTYSNDKYIVFPAHTFSELISESAQMSNCVRTYNKSYANKECDIYLMRLLSNQNKSLVTIEVRNNKVVQSRRKNNELCTKSQLSFINEWQENILKGKNYVKV